MTHAEVEVFRLGVCTRATVLKKNTCADPAFVSSYRDYMPPVRARENTDDGNEENRITNND